MSLSRRKQQCSARTGLLDVVQAVPRLLDECIASVSDFDGIGGVRVFGWISTQARTLSLTAVTSYKMHLSLESEGSEQLSEVARLLKHGKLQRLHVHVITPLDPTQLKNYIPATERLKTFICNMGSSLNHVTVLKLKISTSKLDHISSSSSNIAKKMEAGTASASTHMHSGSKASGKHDGEAPIRKHGGKRTKKRHCSKRKKSSRSCKSVSKKTAPGNAPPMDRLVTLDAEGAGLAAILAHTCPNLRSLIISDGVGSAALAIFGLQCTKLDSLEFSHTFMTATLLQAAITHHLPHLTCIGMTYTAVTCSVKDAAKRASLFKVIRSCAALTHLAVTDGVLCDPSEWVGLPQNLAELVCHDFPLGNMPKDVQLLNLVCLTVRWTAVGLTCTQVHTILHIAPNLKELSTVYGLEEGCSVELNDACTATDMLGWRSLYKRWHQGLELFNMHITINSPVTDTQDRICIEDAMQQMKAYPLKLFTRGKLTNHHGGYSFYHHKCELELVRHVFPGLVTLELCGSWHDDFALCGLRTGPHQTHLLWHGILKNQHNSLFFTDLIENNPSLINIKMESALGQEAKPSWVWNEMVDEYTPLTCGWGGLPFDPRDWIIQRTPSDDKLPKRGMQYLKKPPLTIEED